MRQVITRVYEDSAFLRVSFRDSEREDRERLAVRDALIGEALHMAGVEVVVWRKWIVDIASSLLV